MTHEEFLKAVQNERSFIKRLLKSKTKIMNEQIQNILNENGTKTSKIQKLLTLGLTRRQVSDLVAGGNYGFVQPTSSLT